MYMRRLFTGYLLNALCRWNPRELHQYERSILHNVKRNVFIDSTISKAAARKKDLQCNNFHKNVDNLRVIKLRQTTISEGRVPSGNDPDTFGTLSKELLLQERLQNLPEEENDNEEEYLDGLEGKTRLRTLEYAKIIKNFINKKKLLEALEVLEIRMKKEKAKPDDYIYRLLISGCAKAGYTKKAFQLYNQMKKRNLKVKGGTYTSLFDACANSPWRSDGIKRAAGLWDLMMEKRVEVNQHIAHAAIKAFGRCGDIGRAFSIVDEMSYKKIPVTSETMNFLLQACVSNKEAGFRHALMVWRKMIERKIIPTTYTFNLLLRCTRDCSVGDINQFKEDLATILSASHLELIKLKTPIELKTEMPKNLDVIENKLKNEGGKHYVTILTPQQSHLADCEIHLEKIVKPWHRLMLLGGREGFINMMLSKGSKPDIKTFTQLLYVIGPSTEEEQLLMIQMSQLGIKRDVDFCNMLIKKRNMNNNFSGAKEVLNIIREEKLTPNIVTFGVLAMGCTNLRDTRKLLKDIKAMGFRLNVQILGTLLVSACRSWDFKAIHFLIGQLTKNEIKPNIKFIQHLENLNQEIKRHMEMKKCGDRYMNKLDCKHFGKEYDDFEQLINYVKSLEIEDPIIVHPWNQFKRIDESAGQEMDNTKLNI